MFKFIVSDIWLVIFWISFFPCRNGQDLNVHSGTIKNRFLYDGPPLQGLFEAQRDREIDCIFNY